ncbi:MAG TPA: ABC transporter permease [Amoebophilaceae bacterium]|nr:ABC transporter permease [Amoebophilaceae bacterium]
MKSIGRYFIFLHSMFVNRERVKTYIRQTLEECVSIGVNSIFLVAIVSIFAGAVASIQIYHTLTSPLLGDFLVGYGVREMTILETAPTVMAIVFAARVGSSIAGQLGSMRISEQIDALEILGINTTSYLVLPKILASILTYPFLVIISAFLAIYSGLISSQFAVSVAPADYIYGLRHAFDPYSVYFAIYKSIVYAFLISSISAYRGFYISGGAVAIGKASTRAVTDSCIAILLADYILTQLLLHPSFKI